MSIFTIYKKREDQVTSSLIALLQNSQRSVLEKFLDELVGSQFPTINFINQPKKMYSRPDAEISSNFQILIESKIGDSFNKMQSAKHVQSYDDKSKIKILIIITRESIEENDDEELKINDVIIKNILWSELYEFFDKINKDIFNYNDKTRFLAQQFCSYLEEIGLDNSWKNRVVIIPGEFALKEANKYGLCIWSPDKITKKCGYIAFYYNKRIELLFKLKSLLTFEFQGKIPDFNEFKEKSAIVYGKDSLEDVYDEIVRLEESNDHPWGFSNYVYVMFFDRNDNLLPAPIEHKGKGAFIQRPSYTEFDVIKNAKTTSDIREAAAGVDACPHN